MVIVLGTLQFSPENLVRLRPHIRAVVEATKAHDGCISYEVAEDLFQPGLLRFSEEWPDDATLQRHSQASHMAPWRAACKELGVVNRAFRAYTADAGRAL